VPVQSAPSADDTGRPQPTTSDEKPTTSALAPSAATRRRRRQPKSVEIVESSSPSPPAVKRTATTSDVADDLALSTSTSRPTSEAGSTDDMFVDITDEEAASEIDLPTSRVPTRPLPVAAPHLRRVGRREAEDAVAVRPPATSVPTVKRRRLEMALPVLAQQVIANQRSPVATSSVTCLLVIAGRRRSNATVLMSSAACDPWLPPSPVEFDDVYL